MAGELRRNGISLVLDFVFNHTSDEHEWARRAQAGDPDYADYYYIFPDRTMPDAYERTLREIFPDQRPGSFTYRSDMGSWVWTTFNSFQWDLNYSNPAVFNSMAEETAAARQSRGAKSCASTPWPSSGSEMGTDCENLPGGALADPGVQCGGAHSGARPAVQVGGDRPPRPALSSTLAKTNASFPTIRC